MPSKSSPPYALLCERPTHMGEGEHWFRKESHYLPFNDQSCCCQQCHPLPSSTMGNFLFCTKNAEETILQRQVHPHKSPVRASTVEIQIPRLSGVDGLAFYGFDYRLLKCQKHKSQTNTTTNNSKVCFDCATRLFHTESNTMVTESNYKSLVLRGKRFDDVSGCCQDIVQKQIQENFDLQFVTIERPNGLDQRPIQALISSDLNSAGPADAVDNEDRIRKPVLLVIGGKGKSRAGVLSVKQLIVAGIEKGSALFHIIQAKDRGFSIIILDPNARGETKGYETIDRSFSFLFDVGIKEKGSMLSFGKRKLHVLAHSAAGGFLARYLHNGSARQALLQNISRLVFTDSTHNIQWMKDNTSVCRFLQSTKCLYIRNTSENPSDTFSNHRNKKAGEEHEGNVWWHHRFGNIPTVWAGTPEHSLMCWVSRHIIWDFFTALEQDRSLY